MGQAQKRKQAIKALAADVQLIAHAMRQVIGATTEGYGADCVAYALTGAEVLRRMGHDANAVAGSAAWRVGPGSGDAITHAVELHETGPGVYSPAHSDNAAVFHAWIEVGTHYVDFTTFSLRDKAKQLDAADGMVTVVEWCPDYLVVDRQSCLPLDAVPAGLREGLYSYVRHAHVEKAILGEVKEFDTDTFASMVQMLARSGPQAVAFSIGPDGIQDLDKARQRSLSEGLKPIELSRIVPKSTIRRGD